jgi:DNA-binding NtrC family response regulator
MDKQVKIKLLMVDDEEEFLISSSRALSRRGFEVDMAPNGVTALEFIDRQKFDVIVLDVKMPDIDGIEVFRQIREKQPDMPVVLLTGHSSIDDAFQTSKDGIADYLAKPIDIDKLAEVINRVISNADARTKDRSRLADYRETDEPIKVMLIDDEADFLESMRKVLQRRNMEVVTAENGPDALSLLKDNLVDVAIVDIKMQGMDGLEVLKRIKRSFPSIEVILLTGHPSVETAMEGIKLGANEYMKKPPDIDELAGTIRKLYRNRQEIIIQQQKLLIEEIRRRYPE